MPKGSNKNRIDPKSIATRVMLDKAPQLCTSQIYNELYEKLYKNFMVEVLNLNYKNSDIFDSDIKIDYAYVDCIDELIIDDEEKNKLFKDIEIELKEKYNNML